MSIFSIVAAFGGGVFAASVGALPAFIMCGVLAIAGSSAAMAGAPDVLIGSFAFGAYFGPYVSFAGGVAAAAFASNKKKYENISILTPLFSLGDPVVLLIGGIFGAIGMAIFYLFTNVLGVPTDTGALTVLTSGIIVRFVFGKTGLIGKYTESAPRAYVGLGKELAVNVLIGGSVGLAAGGTAAVMQAAGLDPAGVPVLAFGIAATTLIFAQMGFGVPTTHHIAIVSATAAVMSGCNPWIGCVFGILAAIVGDFATKTFNSHCDTHIDPPAVTIAILTAVVLMIW